MALRARAAIAAMLKDEYSEVTAPAQVAEFESLPLESGLVLRRPSVAYHTWGALNAEGTNGVFVAHALTGNSDLGSWWASLLGPGCAFDTRKYYVICANMLGSCYGTTGPASEMPMGAAPWAAPRAGERARAAGARYCADFPYATLRDTVRLHHLLVAHLGVRRLHAVVGGSAGGMQALEWALMYPALVERVVAIGCGATQSAWQVAISEAQRQAIYRDARWAQGYYAADAPPSEGLAVARQEAMIWYRSHEAYDAKFGRRPQPAELERTKSSGSEEGEEGNGAHRPPHASPPGAPPPPAGAPKHASFSVEGYLEHQGAKFVDRFDANAYVALTRMLDSHDVGRGRGGVEAALGSLRQPTLVIGISSDVLYPLEMQKELVRQLPNATLRVVLSSEGHDGFLLEHGPIGDLIREALDAPVAPDALVEKHVDDLKMSAATAQRILQNPDAMHAAMMSARAEGRRADAADEGAAPRSAEPGLSF